ncbi:hypothetical protein ECG_03355 [Echinococcus granulosus]|uniref:Expressed conserved protein n=1 Tax=Echinococcus granulosus TaxID=6210 RepID=A0A068WVZ2_ECHGR|nr:hypothetical protein ECG_03355 [Echinococcus granulosus]CDS24020.1 hypothetical protein EgrG_002048300 [Echinococcus granulosus]
MGTNLSKLRPHPKVQVVEMVKVNKSCQVQTTLSECVSSIGEKAVVVVETVSRLVETESTELTSLWSKVEEKKESKSVEFAIPIDTIVPRHRLLLNEEVRESCVEPHNSNNNSYIPIVDVTNAFGDAKEVKQPPPRKRSFNTVLERRFWIPVALARVFSDTRDRRLESIARLSDCKITLSPQVKKNVVGDVGRIATVRAENKRGLDRCVNLLSDKFPAFQLEPR